MLIDRSLQLTGQLNDSHISALLELARKRQAEPIDLADDDSAAPGILTTGDERMFQRELTPLPRHDGYSDG